MAKPLLPLFTDFGGLMTEGESTTRPAGTAAVCTNMRVGLGGKTLRKMQGGSRWSANRANGAEPILGMHQFLDKAGIVHEIIRTPSGYYERDIGADTWSSLQSTNQEDDGYPMFAATQGKLFIVDGYSSYTYDGTTWASWFRLTAPVNGLAGGTTPFPTATAFSAAGSLGAEKEYEVFFTFADNANPTKESPPSEIMRVKTKAGWTKIRVKTGYACRDDGTATNPDTQTSYLHLPANVAALGSDCYLYAYMSAANTPGVWYRAATRLVGTVTTVDVQSNSGQKVVSVAATTAFEVGDTVVINPGNETEETGTIASISAAVSITLSANLASTHNVTEDVVDIMTITITAESTSNQFTTFFGPPSRATGLVLHHSRLWTWGSPGYPTRIWFTDLEIAGTFLGEGFIDIGVDQPDDPVRACIPYGAGFGAELLVLRLNSVWKLTGNDFSTFTAHMVDEDPSCLSDRAATRGRDRVVYWSGYEGAYRYADGVVQTLTHGKIREDWRASNGLSAIK